MKLKPASILVLISLMFSPSVNAAGIFVDGSVCTLRDAIRAANADAARGGCNAGSGADDIAIAEGLTIVLSSSLPTIDTVISFKGLDADVTVDGDYNGPLFTIQDTGVSFTDITIANGRRCSIGADSGAGLRISNSTVILDNVILSGHVNCMDPGGAALRAIGSDLTITGSEFRENSLSRFYAGPVSIANTRGAHIYLEDSTALIEKSYFVDAYSFNRQGSAIEVVNSTLTFQDSTFQKELGDPYLYRPVRTIDSESGSDVTVENSTFSAQVDAGQIIESDSSSTLALRNVTMIETALNVQAAVNVTNTILGGGCNFDSGGSFGLNTGNWFADDSCTGMATSGDLLLLSLQDNGGSTMTHALHWTSDAINAGNNAQCTNTDQRGRSRDSQCDIGAYERVDEADVEPILTLVTAPPYFFEQEIIFEVEVRNNGPEIANGVQLDVFTDNLTITQVSGVCTSQPCVINSLPPGTPLFVNFHTTPFSPAVNAFELEVETNNAPGSTFVDPNASNDVAVLEGTQSLAADLSISKDLVTAPPYFIGQTISYNVLIENNGPDGASNVILNELPDGLTITGISNCSNPPAGPCVFPSLPVGNQFNLTATAKIDATTFDNLVTVTSDEYDPNIVDNADGEGNGGNTANDAELRLNLNLDSSPPYFSGGSAGFEVLVNNVGPDPATNVEVDLDFDNVFPIGISGACDTLPCIIPTIPVGTTAVVDILTSIERPGPTSVDAFAQGDQNDPQLFDNADSAGFTALAAADLQIGLTLETQPPYAQGQIQVFELNIINLGADPAENVLIEVLTDNLNIVSALSDNCTELPCTIPYLDFVQLESMEIQAVAPEVGIFSLMVTVSSDAYDPIPADNSDAAGDYADTTPLDIIMRSGMEVQ